jgi:hypothetical protein
MSPNDMAMLSSLSLSGVITPSEKLRKLVRDAYKREMAKVEFDTALELCEAEINPTAHNVRVAELKHHMHSEFLVQVLNWLPDVIALTMARSNKKTLEPQQLVEMEQELADRVFSLLITVLNMSITADQQSYEPKALLQRMPAVLAVSRLLDSVVSITNGEAK